MTKKMRHRVMRHRVIAIIVVLPLVVYSCEPGTQYRLDGNCCNMCSKGKRMLPKPDCKDPFCEECETGEYQDSYTMEAKCKRQPVCDTNLNFEIEKDPSKTERIQCRCAPNHHCSDNSCDICVRNSVCEAGQKVIKMGSQKNDTVCEPCPHGTFSSQSSSPDCQPWSVCGPLAAESSPGSLTSDRTCGVSPRWIIIPLVIILVLSVVIGVLYRKGKQGSLTIKPKEKCMVFCNKTNRRQQPVEDKNDVEKGLPLMVNQPQEDMEDMEKPEETLKHGLSANGMPVLQDVSKSSLLPQPETEMSSQSMSDHL